MSYYVLIKYCQIPRQGAMKKLRQVWAEVNLNNLKDNYFSVYQSLKKGTGVLPVIKGNAYGHGAVAVARQLLECGAESLAVSSVHEGIELRQAGINVPLVILEETPPQGAEKVVEYDLTAAACSFPFISALGFHARQKQKIVKIHVRVDTSYGGPGIKPGDFGQFARKIKEMPWLEIEGIFTHLFAAYTLDGKNVAAQLNTFNEVLAEARRLNLEIPLVHAASSPAIFNYPDSHYNLVRPGIALYGLPPYEGASCDIKPVMQLKGDIVSIKEINCGFSLGYKDNIAVERPLRIATVSIGYGDAFFLFLINNGEALIRGKRAPYFGRSCTATIRLDITDVEDAQVGDEVVFFGEQGDESISAVEVAEKAGIGLLNCETVCLLNRELPRIYLKQDDYEKASTSATGFWMER